MINLVVMIVFAICLVIECRNGRLEREAGHAADLAEAKRKCSQSQ